MTGAAGATDLTFKVFHTDHGFGNVRDELWWILAEAHNRLGDPRAAIDNLERILERPRHRRDTWMLHGYIRPAARFELAGLLAEVGESDQAREHYRILLDTFTDPEPEFRWMVDEARTALAEARPTG